MKISASYILWSFIFVLSNKANLVPFDMLQIEVEVLFTLYNVQV